MCNSAFLLFSNIHQSNVHQFWLNNEQPIRIWLSNIEAPLGISHNQEDNSDVNVPKLYFNIGLLYFFKLHRCGGVICWTNIPHKFSIWPRNFETHSKNMSGDLVAVKYWQWQVYCCNRPCAFMYPSILQLNLCSGWPDASLQRACEAK